MNPIPELEAAGYQFSLHGDSLRYGLTPGREVDPAAIRPLFDELKVYKQEAIDYLRRVRIDVKDDPEYQLFVSNNDTTTKGTPGYIHRIEWEALGRRPVGVPPQLVN